MFDGNVKKLKSLEGREAAQKKRIYTTSRNICSMISFVHNCWDLAAQLENSLTFLACGVSNRVNRFLHYIGLASSNQTANKALKTLGQQAEEKISQKLSTENNKPIAPFLCIDNLDFEQRIHLKSQGKNSKMFHGTWGYIHQINHSLLSSVPPSNLTIDSYLAAMEKIPSLSVSPQMLIPSPEEEKNWILVLKSQIAKVLLQYIAKSADHHTKVPVTPPSIDQISNEPPDLTMLKLMIASDNSAQGISKVCTGIIQQSDLTEHNFFKQLQVIDGDLATCSNVQSL
ncbi:hypothetical protein PCASD_11527 [Puccinia coronata f. sp. avenae]|uniref:DUF6589 domain-containing protein n=1 Tax=Puccinia coronata f. sp. avenae TaxID=200324 RepID=A0A2N5ULV8_9BASI|nr:hypothetical protein PCASD_11527 [Puccinia coronata f. sp. avenae]